jgi:hypothetical protein
MAGTVWRKREYETKDGRDEAKIKDERGWKRWDCMISGMGTALTVRSHEVQDFGHTKSNYIHPENKEKH